MSDSNHSFFPTILFLWGIRLKQFLSGFRRGSEQHRFRNVLLIVIFVAFMVSLTYLFTLLFMEFLTVPVLGIYVMLQTLSLIFLSFFFLLFFSSMVTSLSTQYMSRDLEHLFATDLDSRILYWSKAGEALFHAGWMVVVFAFPVLISYGYAIESPWYYYPASFLVLFPFVLIPFSLGNFLVNTVLYFIPVRRVRSVLLGVGITFGIIMVFVLRLLSPRLLFEPDLARERFVEFLGTLEVGNFTGLPSHHAAYFLHNMTSQEFGDVLYHGIWLLGLALLVPLVLGSIAQYWYRESWLRTREGRPAQSRVVSLGSWGNWSLVGVRLSALLKKELLQFLRQATQWSQLLVLGGIVVVHVSNLMEIPASDQFLNHVLFFVNIALIGFVMTAVCVRFVFPSISFEGEYFWIVRTAPISMFQFFIQKTLFYVLPIGILGAVLAIITNSVLAVSWGLWAWSVVLLTGLSVTLTAGALTAGTFFPKFDYDHFGEVVTSAGSVIYMVFGMFYVAGVVGICIGPIYYALSTYGGAGTRMLETVFPGTVLILTLINLVVGLGCLWLGARKIEDYSFGRL
jgi:ABC-2 type transport system permease protein